MNGARDVDFQTTTVEQAERWFARKLVELGLTADALDEQARTGRFSSEEARRLWMASPNGVPKG